MEKGKEHLWAFGPEILAKMDEGQSQVPPEEVARLWEVWPTKDELAPLVAYKGPGPLRDVERQLVPLIDIPRVKERLRLLVLAGTAEKRVSEAIGQLQLLRKACYELQAGRL